MAKRTFKHLALWPVKAKSAPKAHASPARNRSKSEQTGYILDIFSQFPLNGDHLHWDPDYPWEAYLKS